MSKKRKNKESAYILSPINTKLPDYKIYVMKPMERIITFMILMFVGGLLGYLFYGGLFMENGKVTMMTRISNIIVFIVVGIIANKIFFDALCERKRNKRLNKLKIQFRDFLAGLSTSMTSGMNMNDSLKSTYKDLCSQYSEDSYIAKEVLEMINGMKNNIPIEETIKNLGERSGITDIINFGIVFSVCFRTGGNLEEVIKRSSDLIGEKTIINEEIRTKLTSNKMQMNMMICIPIIMMFLMKNMSSSFRESYASPIGVVAVTVAVGMFIAAYKIGNKIMDVRG